MTQIGSAIGLSVSTIVFNGVLRAQSSSLGVSLDQRGGDDAPPAAQLKAYQAAMWTGFAFGILCGCLRPYLARLGLLALQSELMFLWDFLRYGVVCVFAWCGNCWSNGHTRPGWEGRGSSGYV
jgi:hypothetical protein